MAHRRRMCGSQQRTSCASPTKRAPLGMAHRKRCKASSQQHFFCASPTETSSKEWHTEKASQGLLARAYYLCSNRAKLSGMAHRQAHQSTPPQQSQGSLKWRTGKGVPGAGLTQTHICASPTDQEIFGMAHRRCALRDSSYKPSSYASPTKHMLFGMAQRNRARRGDLQELTVCAGPTEQVLFGVAHRQRALPKRQS